MHHWVVQKRSRKNTHHPRQTSKDTNQDDRMPPTLMSTEEVCALLCSDSHSAYTETEVWEHTSHTQSIYLLSRQRVLNESMPCAFVVDSDLVRFVIMQGRTDPEEYARLGRAADDDGGGL